MLPRSAPLGARLPTWTVRRQDIAPSLLTRHAAALARGSREASPSTDFPGNQLRPNYDSRKPTREASPFSAFLTDRFQRRHDYLRISLTEKCNLRCLYCMPEDGVPQSPPSNLLTTPEIYILSSLFVSQGVTKIRLTGGEPTVRKDILPLMRQIGSLKAHGLRELCLTSNGISLFRKLDQMVESGLTGVNLSLDTLDPLQFQIMTRRTGFHAVMKSMERILEMNKLGAGIKLKVNCVVMKAVNEREIIPFVELGRENDLEVRFIEYMPFSGNQWSPGKIFRYEEMIKHIRQRYPTLQKIQDHQNDTSKTFQVPGFVGKVGFITSMTQDFCGTCNRLRITSDGSLKVCLFGNTEVSLRDIMRQVNDNKPIDEEAFEALQRREAELCQNSPANEPTLRTMIHNAKLLDLIGMTVRKKKAKHAGMTELKNMDNRPMILIGSSLLIGPAKVYQPLCTRSSCIRHHVHKLPRVSSSIALRCYASRSKSTEGDQPFPQDGSASVKLTHVTSSGTAQMVSVGGKPPSARTAVATCSVRFSNAKVLSLISKDNMKKGDVLQVARIAGIMAAKRTPDLIPLCHPIVITHVRVDLKLSSHAELKDTDFEKLEPTSQADPGFGSVEIRAEVTGHDRTGFEMEALTSAATAGLTVYDMCKSVDKNMCICELRVIKKLGGKSGSVIKDEKVPK